MHPSLEHTSHRPWPLPGEDWRWAQSWRHLAFIHYRVDPRLLRGRIPAELRVQEFDGSAWVGVVPFVMCGLRRAGVPALPPLRPVAEVNVRTYVERDGRPGVWFLSLDAASWAVVIGGRAFYGLPYFRARMAHTLEGGGVRFESRRLGDGACFSATYRPVGPEFRPGHGSFEHWMAERYCLYSRVRGATICVDVHHPPWPVQMAEVRVHRSDLLEAGNLATGDQRPRCHFSPGVEVVTYAPRRTDDGLGPALLPVAGHAGPAALLGTGGLSPAMGGP